MKTQEQIEAKLEQRHRYLEVMKENPRLEAQIEALEWVLYPPEKDDDNLVEYMKAKSL